MAVLFFKTICHMIKNSKFSIKSREISIFDHVTYEFEENLEKPFKYGILKILNLILSLKLLHLIIGIFPCKFIIL